jgi:hypothetical protein
VPHINAPPWRTADFGTGSSRVAWPSPLDPGEVKAYTLDCSLEVGEANSIQAFAATLSAEAAVSGLRIQAKSSDRTNVTLWLKINPPDRSSVTWSGSGKSSYLTCAVDVSDGQHFERDVTLQIRQLGQV